MSPEMQVRDMLQPIARDIKAKLPPRWGLALFVFPLEGREGNLNYIATADREDVVNMLKAFIEKSEKSFGEHADG